MSEEITHSLSAQDCLVGLMIAISASDENIHTAQLVKIETAVNNLPVFADYDVDGGASAAKADAASKTTAPPAPSIRNAPIKRAAAHRSAPVWFDE